MSGDVEGVVFDMAGYISFPLWTDHNSPGSDNSLSMEEVSFPVTSRLLLVKDLLGIICWVRVCRREEAWPWLTFALRPLRIIILWPSIFSCTVVSVLPVGQEHKKLFKNQD